MGGVFCIDARRFAASVAALLVVVIAGCGKDSVTKPGDELTVTAVAPDSGNVGTQVEITGTHFEAGASVAFGSHPCTLTELVSPTTLRVYAPDSLLAGTTYDVRVTNSGGANATLVGAYRAVAPELLVVNGVSRPSGNQGSPVIFDGHSFGDLLAKGTVYFTDGAGQPVAAAVALPENWTNEFIMATVPSSAATGPVWIETPTGNTRPIVFTITQNATFSPSAINWTATEALPEGLQGTGATFVSTDDGAVVANRLFVTGGADGSVRPVSHVWQTEVAASGGSLPWTAAPDLPAAVAFHGAIIATPFNALVDTLSAGDLYVIGGIDTSGAATTAVYRATLGLDGQLGGWVTTTPLPVPLHSMGTAIFRSWLFVAGGATAGHQAVATVYRAHIGFDGSLGPWESQPSLPQPRSYAQLVQFAGHLYVAGGDSGAVAPEAADLGGPSTASIFIHGLNLRTAELDAGAWLLNPSTLIKSVTKHSLIVAGATMLVSGGLYNGAGSSATEHQYAEISPDYTVGSFHGATGSQTIGGSSGAGGVPFFNHSAVTYVDDAGQAHVIILGGADVNHPATTIAEAYYY